MDRILEIYFNIKELFGPKIKTEILDVTSNQNIMHVVGDMIYQSILKQPNLSRRELENILGGEIREGQKMPVALEMLKPIEILETAFSVKENHLITADQFPDFSKIYKFQYQDRIYCIIMGSTLLNYESNIRLLKKYLFIVQTYINNTNVNLKFEYLKILTPEYFKEHLEKIYRTINTLSMQLIESKTVKFGVVFTLDYESFKRNFHEDLFFDLDNGIDIRDVEAVKQPYLEIVDSENGFLIINKNFELKGLFFPDDIPTGLEPYGGITKQLYNCLIVKIVGTELIRYVYNNRIIFEIHNGLARTRDYLSFKVVMEKILKSLGMDNFKDKFIKNIIQISNFRKGTIIILGDRVSKDDYSMCIEGEISIIKKRENKKTYRDYILTQLSFTDGAVLVDKQYYVYGFGAILKVIEDNNTNNVSGGSRSYTAEKFSEQHKNLAVIKISEDGPISVYYNGYCNIEI